MITFSPPDIKQRLADALELWTTRLDDQFPDGIPLPEEWDGETTDDAIGPDSVLNVSLRHWDDSFDISCRAFLKLVDDFRSSRFVRAVGCVWPNQSLWRVTPVNPMAHRAMTSSDVIGEDKTHQKLLDEYAAICEKADLIEGKIDYTVRSPTTKQAKLRAELIAIHSEKTRISRLVERPTERRHMIEFSDDGRRVKVCLATGFTLFAMHVVDAGLDHEYFPPVSASEEAFVEVSCSHNLTEEDSLAFVHAYVFELSATAGAEFVLSPRLEVDEDPFGEFSEESSDLPRRFRPLATGKGISELLSIYNRAIGTLDDELRLLCFTKVIEFVAQTVIRRQSTELIRAKLMSSRAISPDAQFITELELLMEQQRAFKKDREAIRLTVSQCCDSTELARHSPPFLKELLVSNLAADPKAQALALPRFADVLYSTRNAIAHAKANYTATGDECPAAQVPAFTACAKVAAEQVIRWFEAIPTGQRVV